MGKRSKSQANLPTLTYAIAHPDAESGIYVRGVIPLANVPAKFRGMVEKQIEKWQTDLPGTLDRANAIAVELLRQRVVKADNEAMQLLSLVAELRGVDESQHRLVMRGYLLGQLMERAAVLAFEPVAAKGKRTVNRAATMRDKQAGIVQKRGKKIAAAVQAHLDANVKNTLSHARKLAAADLGVSPRSVLRATKNLKK